ncbi:MAG: MFS transporter [Candidatus Methylacidiphilales bacterium]
MKAASEEPMPPGIRNAYIFQMFNACSFSIFLGTPVLLYFKSLGASVTVLGIVTAMTPLLNILQIPMAKYVEVVGYRSFVLRGWFIRSFFVLGALMVPLFPDSIDSATKMMLMLAMLFCYNLSRGMSACGFMPWMTQLVPESCRARFLKWDQIAAYGAIVTASIGSALLLRWQSGPVGFALLFAVSYLAALISLYFLRHMPDVEVDRNSSTSKEPVPWKRMLGYQPFTKLLWFNGVMLVGWAGNGVIVIPMLRDRFEVSDSMFMILNGAWSLVFVISLLGMGKMSEWAGNKPVLGLSMFFQLLHFGGWGLIAAGVLPFHPLSIAFQQVTWGICLSLFNVANTRLVMGIVPRMGMSHFFALFSVVTSLVAGIAPVCWGLAADVLETLDARWGGVEINAFSVLYLGVFLCTIAAAALLGRVEEPAAMGHQAFIKELVARTPARAIPRLFKKSLWP